ncbi:MAG: hypothetical protein EOO08_15320 [Chitinophagaceae bacterium]|nr:MAG: hypothetical protein EOO08_15320 [Chitinophagaceae bacterium]
MTRYLLAFLFGLCSITASAQFEQPPYLRFPTLPPLQLLLGDSTTIITKDSLPKGKGVLVLFFSTSCHHCQATTEELVAYRDSLPDITLVLATFASVEDMNAFRKTYGTDKLPHTFVGKDIHFLLPPFYGIQNLPFLAYYNRKGDFVELLNGPMKVPQLMDRIRELERTRK